VVAEPDNSQVLGSGIPQPKDANGEVSGSHPNFRPHAMQGWSPDFVSGLTESAVRSHWVDEILPVSGDDALQLARALATEEGMLVGISSGATLAAALELARRSERGTNIVCMLPDTGERYLSTPLFDDIPVDMTAGEIQLSQSTPLAQFASAPTSPVESIVASTKPALDLAAQNFVKESVGGHPVVMFALEWCEFCWSVRKFLTAMGIEYRSIDLDSVAFQSEDQGGKIRDVLAVELGVPTIPQIYIGGEHIGGATELFKAFSNGELQKRLQNLNLPFDDSDISDVNSFLPQWLQPRKCG
jgi:cysteine synthase A